MFSAVISGYRESLGPNHDQRDVIRLCFMSGKDFDRKDTFENFIYIFCAMTPQTAKDHRAAMSLISTIIFVIKLLLLLYRLLVRFVHHQMDMINPWRDMLPENWSDSESEDEEN